MLPASLCAWRFLDVHSRLAAYCAEVQLNSSAVSQIRPQQSV